MMQAVLRIHFGGPDDEHDDRRNAWPDGPSPAELEDLPYRVEVWDETGAYAETLVAVTVTPALAYAAYYAAAREFVGRDITIRRKGQTLSRWRARMN